MKTSFNYTGRKRLDTSTFDIYIYEKDQEASELEIALNRDEIPEDEIPEDAMAWVEAYRGSKMMRFKLGKLTDCRNERFVLNEFDPAEPVLFRIKLVDENDHKHPIKGWRDQIRPVVYDASGQKKKSVLPVYPSGDLGNIIWRINWDDPSRPVLQVNNKINARNITSIVAKDADFAALVFPQVIREVLSYLLKEGFDDDEENEWIIFAENLVGESCERGDYGSETDNNRVEDWIEKVVERFGVETDLINRYNKFKEGG